MMYSSACVRSSKTGKVVMVVYANSKSFIHVMSLLNNLHVVVETECTYIVYSLNLYYIIVSVHTI